MEVSTIYYVKILVITFIESLGIFYRTTIIDSIWLIYDHIYSGVVNIQSSIQSWNVEKIFIQIVDTFDKTKSMTKDFVFNFLDMCRAIGLQVKQVFKENYAHNVE